MSTLRTHASPTNLYTVTNVNDSGAGSLRQAIIDANNANGADTIEFDLPDHSTIVLGGVQLPIITDTLTIDGSTAVSLTISGNDQSRVFEIGSSTAVTLTHLAIISGTTPTGAYSCPTHCGAGIVVNENAIVYLANSTIDGNEAYGLGGGIYNNGTLVIDNCITSNNLAGTGGGIYNTQNATLTILSSDITDNWSDVDGGGVQNRGALTVTNSTINNNSADSTGGGIYDYLGETVVIDSDISHNSAIGGSGIGTSGSILTITNSTLDSNNMGTSIINVNNSTEAKAWIINSTVNNTLNGSGVRNSGIMHISNSSINNNTNRGIVNDGSLIVENSTISYNSNGGIFNQHNTIEIINSTINDNSSSSVGGGVYSLNSNSMVTLINSTLSNNSAVDFGGGIYSYRGVISLYNTTLQDNTANEGGGIYLEDQNDNEIYFSNSIVANSQSGGDCVSNGSVIDSGFNLIEDDVNSCGLSNGVNNNIVGVDPQLGPLQFNGGDTFTHALLNGSSAIDTGNCSGGSVTNDQRGALRPHGIACDIGAFELGGVQPTAVNDQASTTPNTAVLINVLANDSPGDGGVLDLSAVGLPLSGTAVISDDMVLYTPDLDFTGMDVFTYTVSDGVAEDTAVVSVTVDYLKIYLPITLKNE